MWSLDRTKAAIRMRRMRRRANQGPVPLASVAALRRELGGRDVLVPSIRSMLGTGRDLANPFLKDRLAGAELGLWSLPAPVLNLLETAIRNFRPEFVLEFGSGVSTVCLARFMDEIHPGPEIRVVSVEQSPEARLQTLALLEELGLEGKARVALAPLKLQAFGTRRLNFYAISEAGLRAELNGQRPDFVLIDGPAAEDGARYGAVPLARTVVDDARFFLDDALRDGELDIAERWARLPGVDVVGMHLVGKGLLEGRLSRCGS